MTDARGRVAEVSYFGPVFRATLDGPQERRQVGIESYGRADREAADAEILALALEGARLAGRDGLKVRLGDASLLNEVMGRLGLSARWSRRLRRALARGGRVADVASAPAAASPIHSGVLAAIGKADHDGAKSLVADLLAISGIKPIGGRDIGEIAERLLSKAERGADEPIGAERLKVLEVFLAVRGDPDGAAATLRAFAKDAGLDLAESLDRLEARIGFIAARGLDVEAMDFSTHFLREYDYYSGFLFDAAPADATVAVVGGGRYDALARQLGASEDLPAVGAAIWLDVEKDPAP